MRLRLIRPAEKPDPLDRKTPGRRIRHKEKRFELQQGHHGQCRSGIGETRRETSRHVEEICCGRDLSASCAAASGRDLRAQKRLKPAFFRADNRTFVRRRCQRAALSRALFMLRRDMYTPPNVLISSSDTESAISCWIAESSS